MKAITLTKIIAKERKSKTFDFHFQKELIINQIAKMFVDLRKEAKLTQNTLAKKAGTTQPVIARLESGSDNRLPSLDLLTRIAAATHTKLKITLQKTKTA